MEHRTGLRAAEGGWGAGDERGPRSSASGARSALARTIAQHRAFLELARLVAAGDQGLWTGALSILLGPVGAPWGVAYRLSGSRLERVASEGVPLSLRGHLEAFDVGLQAGLAVCRAVRTRRAVSDERMFAAVVDAGEAEQLEAAGIGAATAVPVAHGSSVVGVLVVGASMRDGMEADALTFLDAVAALLAPAVGAADAGRLPVSEDRRSSSAPPRASVAAEAAARKAADVGRAAVEAVGQCGGFLRRAGIDVRVAAEEGCMAVGEGSDIGLAIAHLVTNAVEAVSERAPRAGVPSQPRRVRVSVAREGGTIVVGVDDSGRGVPPDLRGRVFEPGFSTKGKGRGKGLHVVRQMALEAGGHVEIGASELGGASFRMVLPASLVRTPQSSSGLWNAGVTWPQMRVPIAEVGEEDAEGRAVGAARRTGSSG